MTSAQTFFQGRCFHQKGGYRDTKEFETVYIYFHLIVFQFNQHHEFTTRIYNAGAHINIYRDSLTRVHVT